MGHMTDEERIDDFIAAAARELDVPPAVPRDEMWIAITAARLEETAAADAASADAAVLPIGTRSQQPPQQLPQRYSAWLRYGAAAAAVLVIGIGLGRFSMADRPGNRPAAPLQQASAPAASADPAASAGTADTGSTSPAAADPTLAALNQPPITGVAPDNGGTGLARSVKRPERANSGGAVLRDAANETSDRPAIAQPAAPADAAVEVSLSYRVASRRHLARAHTLLVSIPGDVRDGRINEVAARAADLLVNTRLLLDSPAANEPEVRRLLDDLELILAQAATLSPTRSAEDVSLIQNAINQRDVLIRLHAVTAGPRLSGT
jgi:hypothetical protein